MILVGYHGTDFSCGEQIVRSDFTYKKSKFHWLGNGVYFYLDFSLARWWTTNPSRVFGTKVSSPSIIKANINIDECSDGILDLRKLSDYDMFTNLYFDEFIPLVETGAFNIKLSNTRQMRCLFCDYLKNQYDLKLIIGNFLLPEQPYLNEKYKVIQSKMNLSYIETQICVFDTSTIINKELIKVGE